MVINGDSASFAGEDKFYFDKEGSEKKVRSCGQARHNGE
jgi:hypothetical protein